MDKHGGLGNWESSEVADAVNSFFDSRWKWQHTSWASPSQVFRARHWAGHILMRIQIQPVDTDHMRLHIVNERSEAAYDWGLNARDVRQLHAGEHSPCPQPPARGALSTVNAGLVETVALREEGKAECNLTLWCL